VWKSKTIASSVVTLDIITKFYGAFEVLARRGRRSLFKYRNVIIEERESRGVSIEATTFHFVNPIKRL
jgi:hypothetical protein